MKKRQTLIINSITPAPVQTFIHEQWKLDPQKPNDWNTYKPWLAKVFGWVQEWHKPQTVDSFAGFKTTPREPHASKKGEKGDTAKTLRGNYTSVKPSMAQQIAAYCLINPKATKRQARAMLVAKSMDERADKVRTPTHTPPKGERPATKHTCLLCDKEGHTFTQCPTKSLRTLSEKEKTIFHEKSAGIQDARTQPRPANRRATAEDNEMLAALEKRKDEILETMAKLRGKRAKALSVQSMSMNDIHYDHTLQPDDWEINLGGTYTSQIVVDTGANVLCGGQEAATALLADGHTMIPVTDAHLGQLDSETAATAVGMFIITVTVTSPMGYTATFKNQQLIIVPACDEILLSDWMVSKILGSTIHDVMQTHMSKKPGF